MILPAGKRKNNRSGFTLIEILITLAIIGMIVGLSMGQIGKILSLDMKKTAKRLGSTIRYLYHKSATESLTLRLVFDIDESSYWVEGTSGPFALVREEDEEEEDEEEEDADAAERVPIFTRQESRLLKPIQLPSGVYFKDIYAEHQIDRISEGRAYIYFFPQGYVERSVINLRDKEDEKHFSIEVNPISGSVKILKEYKEPEIE